MNENKLETTVARLWSMLFLCSLRILHRDTIKQIFMFLEAIWNKHLIELSMLDDEEESRNICYLWMHMLRIGSKNVYL